MNPGPCTCKASTLSLSHIFIPFSFVNIHSLPGHLKFVCLCHGEIIQVKKVAVTKMFKIAASCRKLKTVNRREIFFQLRVLKCLLPLPQTQITAMKCQFYSKGVACWFHIPLLDVDCICPLRSQALNSSKCLSSSPLYTSLSYTHYREQATSFQVFFLLLVLWSILLWEIRFEGCVLLSGAHIDLGPQNF